MEFENENPTLGTGDAQNQSSGGQEGVVGSPQETEDPEVRSEGEGTGAAQPPQTGDADRETDGQDRGKASAPPPAGGRSEREFNAAMAATRRRAEAETAARLAKERDEQIAAMKIPNPAAPGAFFQTMKDLEAYSGQLRRTEAQKRADKQGRDVEEVMAEDEERAFVRAQMAKADAEKEAARAQRERQDFIARDLHDFQTRHPDVDVAALDLNPAFRRFAGSRYGREPLADLYDDFTAIAGEAEAAAVARQEGRRERGTGAGSGGGTAGALTAEQRAALRAWNESNPHMKMSEKEFLEM